MAARRVGVARALLLVPFALLAARAAHLSVIDQRGERLGLAQSRRVLTLPPERGTIVDRAGAELALTIDAPSVYAIPSQLENPDATARALSKALGISRRRVARRLEGASNFRFVARWISPRRAERVRALDLPGIGVLAEPRRVYPHKELAAQVVGFSNIDGAGVRGIEQQEDHWLRGTARRLSVERDARGGLLVFDGGERWQTTGGDVALTLDATMQSVAHTALAEAMENTGARGGVLISMNPHTGEILALAEAPTFDPNQFRDLDYRATRSRAFLDAADPGSTLKAFLVAAAIDRKAIDGDDTFDCGDGSFRVPGKTIHDRRAFGVLDARGVLRVSSNIGAVKIAHALGPSAHFEMLRSFGFGESTRSGFPDESAGVLRAWQTWKPLDHATIAFGQGVAVTPIQLAAATAAIANGGTWVQPHLVTARRAAGSPWRSVGAVETHRAIRPETAAAVLEMLTTVVGPEGTGRLAALEGVRVAGKTGTAQKFDSAAGTYSQTRYVAWFVGAVPADDPALVIVAGLDEPKRPHHTGGAAAAPLFARVAAAHLAGFGILTRPSRGTPLAPPVEIASEPDASARRKTARPRPAPVAKPKPPAPPRRATPPPVAAPPKLELAEIGGRVLVPDFLGQTDAELRRLSSALSLRVEISGSGRAVAQDPPAGTVVAADGGRVRVICQRDEGEI